MPSVAEVAWAAGIIDGEGCVCLVCNKAPHSRRRSPFYQLTLIVKMCHERTIRKLQSIFATGSVRKEKKRVPKPGSPLYWSTAYSWTCAQRQSERVLKAIRPHAITKAKEVEVALEFLSLPRAPAGRPVPKWLHRKRESYFMKLRNMKSRSKFLSEKRRQIHVEASTQRR